MEFVPFLNYTNRYAALHKREGTNKTHRASSDLKQLVYQILLVQSGNVPLVLAVAGTSS